MLKVATKHEVRTACVVSPAPAARGGAVAAGPAGRFPAAPEGGSPETCGMDSEPRLVSRDGAEDEAAVVTSGDDTA
ncbi:hypothetical protein EV183_001520, partial [Coemansia sp. RSA 2336]